MNINKKWKIIISILLIFVLGVVFYLLSNKSSVSKWDDPEYVFDIVPPTDFEPHQIERLDEKIIEGKKLYQEKKDHNWTWIAIGSIYEFVGDYEKAIESYQKAIELEALDFFAPFNIATINEKHLEDYEKAEEYYEKAIQIRPMEPSIYLRLAKMYQYRLDRLDDAEAILKQGIENTGNDAVLMINLIKLYDHIDKPEDRNEYIEKLLELYPDNELYRQEYGHLVQ